MWTQVDTNISEKHTVYIFRAMWGFWNMDSLYRVRRRARLEGNWPVRVEE
jgi:hypothetical protein